MLLSLLMPGRTASAFVLTEATTVTTATLSYIYMLLVQSHSDSQNHFVSGILQFADEQAEVQ